MTFANITKRLADTGGAKWAVHAKARAMQRAGADIVELTIGEPDIAPDPNLIDVAHKAMLAGRTRYSSGAGEPELLDAIAAKYSARRPGITADNVLCFPGTQTALFATMMTLVGEEDAVLVGDPFYATYEGVIRASGAHRISVPLRPENGFQPQIEDFERALAPSCKVLLLNFPHNPSGAILSDETAYALGTFAARHDLWIVCDEVYEDLIFDGDFNSLFNFPDFADRTIAVSSISKSCAAPGFRSGWAVGPKAFCEAMLPLSEAMLFGNQPFIADMTTHAIQNPPETAKIMRADYARRAALLHGGLSAIGGIKPHAPQSGMFLLADVSETGMDGDTVAWALLDAGVAVMPGSSFGNEASKLIRLSLTVPDEKLEEAIRLIANYVAAL